MQTFTKHRRHLLSVLLGGLILALTMGGCGSKTGKLDEGDCKCTIVFSDIPKVVSMLEENVQNNFSIGVTLKNIATEKLYYITLNRENDFRQEISVNSGVYDVYSVHAGHAAYTDISVIADVESVRLSPDTSSEIHIYVNNEEEFTQHWMSVQPMPEMLLAEKFDGLIQINRQIVDLKAENIADLAAQLNPEEVKPVGAHDTLKVTDTQLGVQLTLINTSDQAAEWQNCQLLELYVYKNNVVFPQGVTLGMAPSTVCHKTDGLYGEPDAFTGSLLYGWGFDDTSVAYTDEETGDTLTLNLSTSGSYIASIRYKRTQY